MGHFDDFLNGLLGDNVINDIDKIVRDLRTNESQSKISNRDWKHRQEYCRRAMQIKQRNVMRTFHNMRSRVKSS